MDGWIEVGSNERFRLNMVEFHLVDARISANQKTILSETDILAELLSRASCHAPLRIKVPTWQLGWVPSQWMGSAREPSTAGQCFNSLPFFTE